MFNFIPLAATIGSMLDEKFFGLDTAIFTFFGNLQNGFLTIIAKIFTSFGDENFVIPVVVLALLLCLFKRTRKYGFAIVMSVAIGTILTNLWLKPMVLRVRPDHTLQHTDCWAQYKNWYAAVGSLSESDYSFPSGHSTSAFEMATAACLCFATEKKGKIAWIPPVLALGTACSRIYVMVHYPTDVMAGSLVGICAGVVGFLLALLICRIVSKIGFLDKIDLEKAFKKGLNTKVCSVLIAVFLCIVLGISFGKLMTESDEIKCAYDQEYDCNNKARIGEEKYPPIDGKNYCKIHWKELSGEDSQGENEPVSEESAGNAGEPALTLPENEPAGSQSTNAAA